MPTHPLSTIYLIAAGAILIGASCRLDSPGRGGAPLAEADRLAVEEVCNKLAAAWLAGDEKAILSLYTEDAVLIPHHGEKHVVRREGIQRYWFNPLFEPTRVSQMDNTVLEVTGAGDYAFVRGRGMLQYVFQGRAYSNTGNFFHVMRRTPEGWKIFRHVWTDPVPLEDGQ